MENVIFKEVLIKDGMSYFIVAEWRIYTPVNKASLVRLMACRLVSTKPLSEPMLDYCQLEP